MSTLSLEELSIPAGIALLQKYFPLTEIQKQKFTALGEIYPRWNEKINLVSRKDISHLFLHHILHSLSIAKLCQFAEGTKFIDAGTGGGFPGIPLSIMFPDCSFLLIDSTGKKINAVNGIINELGLKNVKAMQARVESLEEKADFVTGRAVSNIGDFYKTVKHLVKKEGYNSLANGIIYLAGGEVGRAVAPFGVRAKVYNISEWFSEEYFLTKKIVHIRT